MRIPAVACLFHEHEWEGQLLLNALRSEAFYVGAPGSRQTQRRRVEVLEALGATAEEVLARLKGPIGLFPSQDPRSLAVSALAEIVKVRTAARRRSMSLAMNRTAIVMLASGLSRSLRAQGQDAGGTRRPAADRARCTHDHGADQADPCGGVSLRPAADRRTADEPFRHRSEQEAQDGPWPIPSPSGVNVALQFKPDAILLVMGDMPFLESWVLDGAVSRLCSRGSYIVLFGRSEGVRPPTVLVRRASINSQRRWRRWRKTDHRAGRP